ncbi:MAG: DUF805 domain-containing protein [Hyphomonas sp.]|nr:DUF805 domain-containing protein [Hyphomonas sp.]
MKGTVERQELAGDPGQIRGDDGKLYHFMAAQVRNGAVLTAGDRVDFIGLGEDARDIHLDARTVPPPAEVDIGQVKPVYPAQGVPPAYAPKPPARDAGSLWTYFMEGLTKKYAQFTGRARRSEYWGYTLFWWIATIGILILDSILLGLTSAMVGPGEAFWYFYLTIIWQLGTLIPNIAIVVRRLHDLNLSGWMYLLKLGDGIIPWAGSIAILICMLIDGKPEKNVHGTSPKYGQGDDVISVFS